MCISTATEWIPPRTPTQKHRPRRLKVRVVHRLNRRERKCEEKDMELKNLKLYMENISIQEENDKLREKASLLHQENLALLSEYQKKFSRIERFSATLFLLPYH